MAKAHTPINTSADVTAAIGEIQKQQIEANEAPLNGVEAAALLGAMQPAAAPEKTAYIIKERTDPQHQGYRVLSPDGTVEDAIRAFNNGRATIRTAKQLIIERASA